MRAAPLATDNFDTYTAGATLVGADAGAGWSAAWTGQDAYANIVTGSANTITYTLDNGEIRGGGNALKITAPAETEQVGIVERAVPEITDGGDVFVSLIFKIKSGSVTNPDQFDGQTFTTNNNVYYYAGDGAKSPTADAAGFAGYAGKAGARLAGGWLGVQNPLVINQTYFLVIRYSGWNVGTNSTNTYDTITTWLNPTTNDEDKASPSTTTTNNSSNDNTVAITRVGDSLNFGSTKFSSLYLNTLGLNATTRYHIVDDIRVGRTWADVVGIPMPVVTAIAPSSVMAGDPVIIDGKSLGDVSAVTIGGLDAAITAQSATALTVTVPAALGLGEKQIVVTGPGGSVTKTLTIIRPPLLDSATPDSGAGGATVVLAGRNLEESAVTIGAGAGVLPCEIVSNTGTALTLVIPAGLANGAQTITVTTNAGTAAIAFTNTAPTPPPPALDSADSLSSRAGGTVTLAGANLVGATTVTVGGLAAQITARADDALTFVIPAGLTNDDHAIVITTAAGATTVTITLTDLIAADDFNTGYPPGAPIAGAAAAAGTGWAGAWTANPGITVTDDPADAVTYTLSDGTVRGGGPALKLALDTPLLGAFPRVLERDLARPVTTGEDVFVSFVCKIKNPSVPPGSPLPAADNVTSIWYAKDDTPDTTHDTLACIGYNGKVGANFGSPANTVLVSTPLNAERPFLVVLRYGGWNGTYYKKCNVWLNPANNDETAASPAITIERPTTSAGYGSAGFLGLCVDALGINSAGRHQIIDDLRIGYTWAAVTGPRTDFIAAENFDSYAHGAKLAGAAAGAGWDGPWTAQAGGVTITADPADAVTHTLDNGTVRGGGPALKITGTGADAAATVAGVLERRFARVPDGDDVYASFVFKIKNPAIPDGSPLTGDTTALWYAADAAKDPNRDAAAYAGQGGKAGAKLATGWPAVTTPLIAGQTYFMVVRYSGWNAGVQAYDTVTTWLNPGTGDEAKGTGPGAGNGTSNDPAVAITREGNTAGYGNTDIRGLYVSTLGLVAGGASHIVDDLRVGATWQSVVGAPPPPFVAGPPPVLDPLPTADLVPGETLTLTGANLNLAGLVRVMIGGVEAVVTAAADTALTVTIPADAVNGAVAVFTAAGSCIPAETLTLATRPVLVSAPPAAIVAVENRPVHLAAGVWATGSISYQWQCRPNAAAAWQNVPADLGAGAATAVLELTAGAGKTGWQFRCVAATAAGAAETPPATLTVIENLLAAPAALAISKVGQTFLSVPATGHVPATDGQTGMSVLPAGILYIADRAAHTISALTPANGNLAPLAGITGTAGDNDGTGATGNTAAADGTGTTGNTTATATGSTTGAATTATAALFNAPRGLAFAADGALLVADTGNDLLRSITTVTTVTTATTATSITGSITTVTGITTGTGRPAGTGAVTGTTYTVNVSTLAPAGPDATFVTPAAIAAGTDGTLYIADTGNHLIKILDATGTAQILAGSGVSGTDNGALLAAAFNTPAALAVTGTGDTAQIYIADTANHVIRLVDLAAGQVTTFAGQMSVAGAADGAADAGGAALVAATFDSPAGLALDDAAGLLYVADTGNSRVRAITTGTAARVVSTLAGSAPGFRDGPGADAWFNAPEALALAPDGALYIADTGNAVIRRIAPGADAHVTTPALKSVPFPPAAAGAGDSDNNKTGGGGGGAPSAPALALLAALLAWRRRKSRASILLARRRRQRRRRPT